MFAQSDADAEKKSVQRKIELTIRRIDDRIEKIDKDMKKEKDANNDEPNDFKAKLEASKAELQSDLKEIGNVKKDSWKEFADEVNDHLKNATATLKPVVL